MHERAALSSNAALAVLGIVWAGLILAEAEGFLYPLSESDWPALAIFVMASVGVGLVTGRKLAVLIAFALLAWLLPGDLSGFQVFSICVLGVPFTMLCIGAGVLMHRVARRAGRRLRHQGYGAQGLGLALMAVGLLPFAVATHRHIAPVNRTPGHPIGVDPLNGTYRGVGLGSRYTDVVGTFGRSRRQPSPYRPGRQDLISTRLTYPDVDFALYRTRVDSVLVTDADAQTHEGVGIGDNLRVAERAYPSLDCGVQSVGADGDFVPLPHCSGELAPGHWVSFSDDPIRSICFATRDIGC